MNVSTNYKTEAAFYAAIGAPSVAPKVQKATTIDGVNEWRNSLHDNMTLNNELRHDLNMAAWHELHAEHMAAGRFEIASNIMRLKIIPNRS